MKYYNWMLCACIANWKSIEKPLLIQTRKCQKNLNTTCVNVLSCMPIHAVVTWPKHDCTKFCFSTSSLRLLHIIIVLIAMTGRCVGCCWCDQKIIRNTAYTKRICDEAAALCNSQRAHKTTHKRAHMLLLKDTHAENGFRFARILVLYSPWTRAHSTRIFAGGAAGIALAI